ncbi:MAG: nucleotide exchange factor GrpE [bacterium]
MFGKQKNNENKTNEQESLNPFVENKQEQDETQEQQVTTFSAEEYNQLKADFDKLKAESGTRESQYIRLVADFDNFRKRYAQEREELLKYGAEDTVTKILPLLDTFEMARKSIKEMDDAEKIKESFGILQKQFTEALEKLGLQKIEAEGQKFDPNLHEAVKQTPSDEHEDQTVIDEYRSGFMLNNKVIRPTMVNVAANE